jgi:hypothetical protein
MEIKSISQKIFKTTSPKIGPNNNQTNPFGVNFNGSMVHMDVFESSSPKLANKGKIWASAMVGSINESISKRLDSLMAFGRNIRNKSIALWEKAGSIEITLGMPNFTNIGNSLKGRISEMNEYSVRNLKKLETDELGNMFKELVEA